jgi:hypothetical protein
LLVPSTCAIRYKVIPTWFFADPKDGGHDVCFPPKWPRSSRERRSPEEIFIFARDSLHLPEQQVKRDKKSKTKKER